MNRSLAHKLIKLTEADQTMRTRFMEKKAEWDSTVDEANQGQLKSMVSKVGWLSISKVGAEASHAAWLLVQHAPDLAFMEKCLALMKALPSEDINPANIAYLEDRVLMRNGKLQIYGTQYRGMGQDMEVYPINDPEHVDERRASVGLDTMAENEARLRKLNENKSHNSN